MRFLVSVVLEVTNPTPAREFSTLERHMDIYVYRADLLEVRPKDLDVLELRFQQTVQKIVRGFQKEFPKAYTRLTSHSVTKL